MSRGNYDHIRCPVCGICWEEHHAPNAAFASACTVQFHPSRPTPPAVEPSPFSLNGHVIAAEATTS